MAKLEHVNLVVKDINETLKFIQTAFPHWKIRGQGENAWSGKKRNWLHVGTDDYYITLNDGAAGENRDLTGHAPGLAHIGFEVDNIDAVVTRLQNNGYEIRTKGADHPHRKTVYFLDPAGFEFEFIQYFSDLPEERNLYGGETTGIVRMTDSAEQNVEAYARNLYRIVDSLDLKALADLLDDNVRFYFANADAVIGKEPVVNLNHAFFESIQSMSHTLRLIAKNGNNIIIDGTVTYIRKDGTTHSITFATILEVINGLITDYRIYADTSEL